MGCSEFAKSKDFGFSVRDDAKGASEGRLTHTSSLTMLLKDG